MIWSIQIIIPSKKLFCSESGIIAYNYQQAWNMYCYIYVFVQLIQYLCRKRSNRLNKFKIEIIRNALLDFYWMESNHFPFSWFSCLIFDCVVFFHIRRIREMLGMKYYPRTHIIQRLIQREVNDKHVF